MICIFCFSRLVTNAVKTLPNPAELVLVLVLVLVSPPKAAFRLLSGNRQIVRALHEPGLPMQSLHLQLCELAQPHQLLENPRRDTDYYAQGCVG